MTKWQKAAGGVNRLKHPIFLRNEGVEGAMSNWHAFLLVDILGFTPYKIPDTHRFICVMRPSDTCGRMKGEA